MSKNWMTVETTKDRLTVRIAREDTGVKQYYPGEMSIRRLKQVMNDAVGKYCVEFGMLTDGLDNVMFHLNLPREV